MHAGCHCTAHQTSRQAGSQPANQPTRPARVSPAGARETKTTLSPSHSFKKEEEETAKSRRTPPTWAPNFEKHSCGSPTWRFSEQSGLVESRPERSLEGGFMESLQISRVPGGSLGESPKKPPALRKAPLLTSPRHPGCAASAALAAPSLLRLASASAAESLTPPKAHSYPSNAGARALQ